MIISSVLLSVFLQYLPTHRRLSLPHLVYHIVRSTFAMVDTLFASRAFFNCTVLNPRFDHGGNINDINT